MTIQDFNKKYILVFSVNEFDPINIEFTLEIIYRNTLLPTLDYKKIKSEIPTEWLSDKMEEEVNEGRHPDKFRVLFYENSKRKLINTLLIKNNIRGLNALDIETDLTFLFK